MWNTARISYFSNDKRRLIVEAVQPCVEEIKRRFTVEGVVLKRHWKFGPHVDINIRCDKALFETEIFPLISDGVTQWLAENPSSEVLDPAQYGSLSEKLGRLEFEDGPYLPLYENNRVFVGDYNARSELYHDERIVAAKERFQSDAFDLLMTILRIPEETNAVKLVRLAQVAAQIADGYPGGQMLYGHLSYRSHSEFFFSENANGAEMRARFEAFDKQIGAHVDDAVDEVIGNRSRETDVSSFIGQWKLLIDKFRATLKAIIEEDPGKYQRYEKFDELSRKHNVYRFDNNAPVNEFGQVFSENFGESIFNTVDFQVHRLVINTFYTFLPLLEVSPNHKFLLCYLVSNSIERRHNTHWKQLIKKAG